MFLFFTNMITGSNRKYPFVSGQHLPAEPQSRPHSFHFSVSDLLTAVEGVQCVEEVRVEMRLLLTSHKWSRCSWPKVTTNLQVYALQVPAVFNSHASFSYSHICDCNLSGLTLCRVKLFTLLKICSILNNLSQLSLFINLEKQKYSRYWALLSNILLSPKMKKISDFSIKPMFYHRLCMGLSWR